jgi:Fe2+ or Zn2+ uptake regulation protein
MYDQRMPMEGRTLPHDATFGASEPFFGKSPERGGNERIRQLLKSFGLRTSLIRLKVIDALLNAADNERALGVRGVHSHLVDLDIPLSFLSVREVLKRLCSEGVVELNSDKTYSLQPQAVARLHELN